MPSQPTSAASFLNTLGINAHSGFENDAYANSSLVVNSLAYLGINTVRDAFAWTGKAKGVIDAVAATGIKFDFVVSSGMPADGDAGLSAFVTALQGFAEKHPGGIFAVEGLNEANIQAFSYKGDGSLTAAAAYQKALYTAVKGNSVLANTAVINLSIGLESDADYAKLGDLGAYSDYANAHAYTATFEPADAVMERSLARAQGASKGDPVIITETGYTTLPEVDGLGVTNLAQAKLTLTALLNAYENGSQKTFLYELFDSSLDPTGHDMERHFGLFYADGTPKMAATAVHNLTTILSYTDQGIGLAATAASAYSLGGMPKDGHVTTLTKANGAYDIVLWRDVMAWDDKNNVDRITAASTISVDLGGVQKTVYVYDPLGGTDPVAVYHDVSRITVPVSDRPMIVEVGSSGPVATVKPVAVADMVATADQLVAQIDKLAASTGLNSVTLQGGSVLHVSSVDTMRYMIANYGGVLSKVKGGYSFAVATDGMGWREEMAFDAAGALVSTTESAMVNGVATSTRVVNVDGSSASYRYDAGKLVESVETARDGTRTTTGYDTGSGNMRAQIVAMPNGDMASTTYNAGVKATYTLVHKDGSKVTDTFNASGARTSEVTVDTANTWTTSLYDAATGKLSRMFVDRADGSGENSTYGITGQSYVTEKQVVNAKKQVVSVVRSHADGSLDYSYTVAGDGSTIAATFDAKGMKLLELRVAADGGRTTDTFDATTGKLARRIAETGSGVTTTVYTGDVVTRIDIVRADGSRVNETFDTAGAKLSSVTVDTAGTWTTSLYQGGALAKSYVDRADGGGENTTYGITGQSYVTEKQVVNAKKQVIAVTRSHADGSLDYSYAINSDGSSLVANFDAKGVKLREIATAADGGSIATDYDAAIGKPARIVTKRTDGTSTAADYRNGALATLTQVATDGARKTETFAASGVRLSDVTVDAKSNWQTWVFDGTSGALTNRYVTNADGSGETTTYGVTGKTYTFERQTTDPQGHVLTVTRVLAAGGETVLTYNAAGRLLQDVTVDAGGTWTTQVFDATTGKLTQKHVTRPDGTSDHSSYNVTGKTYVTDVQTTDKTGKVMSVTRTHANGTLDYTEATDSAGAWTSSVYDAQGRLAQSVAIAGNTTKETVFDVATGAASRSTVAVQGGMTTAVTYLAGTKAAAVMTNPDGTRVIESYDGKGILLSRASVDSGNNWTTTTFDAATGAATRRYVSNGDGTGETVTYGIVGQAFAQERQVTDASGKVVLLSRARADGTAFSAETKDADGTATFTTYDANGRRVLDAIASPDGSTTNVTFDATTGLATRSIIRRADGSGIDSSFAVGVLASRTTISASGTSTVELFDAAKHDLTVAQKLAAGAPILVAGQGSAIVGSAADEVLLADHRGLSLTGGAGDDRFLVTLGGSASISDFGAGHDLLDLSAFSNAGYKPTIALDGANTLLKFANGDSLTLVAVDPSRLVASSQQAGVYSFA